MRSVHTLAGVLGILPLILFPRAWRPCLREAAAASWALGSGRLPTLVMALATSRLYGQPLPASSQPRPLQRSLPLGGWHCPSAVSASAGSSPPTSQSAALPSSSAWPLSASGYARSFSSIAPAPSIAGTHWLLLTSTRSPRRRGGGGPRGVTERGPGHLAPLPSAAGMGPWPLRGCREGRVAVGWGAPAAHTDLLPSPPPWPQREGA